MSADLAPRRRDARHLLAPACALLLMLLGGAATGNAAGSYPIDGYERSGIRRLWATAHREQFGLPTLPPGAQMPLDSIRLRLLGAGHGFDIDASTPRDPDLQEGLEAIFADRDPNYSIALLDITDPGAPHYAALEETRAYLPGSIGKLLVTTGLFDAMARAFPDPAERLHLLRNTWIEADDFVIGDSHSVPIVDVAAATRITRVIQPGDRFTLFEWIDHALSPSANAAGATAWKQAMLLRAFGAQYPPSPEQAAAWFDATPKAELTRLSLEALETPLREAGLNTEQLRQGTMFTRGGRAHVPGVRSVASPRELLRLLVRIEQGRLIDDFSSLEIKRLLYFTRRRYRYAVSPALAQAAVYFKSGSFYRCKQEPDFHCHKYAGNVQNVMNSVAIIESPARPAPEQQQRVYLVAMMSNVLRLNSAAEHRDIATAIEHMIAARHAE